MRINPASVMRNVEQEAPMKIGILECGHTMPETNKPHGDLPVSGLDQAKARAGLPDDKGLIASHIAAFFKQPREAIHA